MKRLFQPLLAPQTIAAALAALLAASGWAVAVRAAEPEGDDPAGSEAVAEVMGNQITRAELEEAAAAQLGQIEEQLVSCQKQAEQGRFQALEANLEGLIEDRMLSAEAGARGVSKEALVAAEIDAKVEEVTDADVDAWFEENRARLGGRTKESIAAQIQDYLTQQRQQAARSTYLSDLKRKYRSRVLLEPPRVQVAAEGPAQGPATAPVTIVEFSDFQCPFCSRVAPTLDQVRQRYGDKVRIVYRHFPLGFHAHAQKAAEASLCADQQGKFWEMHDLLFADQQALAVEQLEAKASQLGLDVERFSRCLDSGATARQVAADFSAGQAAGVTGTPALFVNGILISGAVPFEQIASVIDKELERKGIFD